MTLSGLVNLLDQHGWGEPPEMADCASCGVTDAAETMWVCEDGGEAIHRSCRYECSNCARNLCGPCMDGRSVCPSCRADFRGGMVL